MQPHDPLADPLTPEMRRFVDNAAAVAVRVLGPDGLRGPNAPPERPRWTPPRMPPRCAS